MLTGVLNSSVLVHGNRSTREGRPSGPAMVLLETESVPREDRAMWKVNLVSFLCGGLLVALQRPSKLFLTA